MDPFYCIISTSAEDVADLCVLDATTDEAALRSAADIPDRWSDVETVAVYQGERRVGVLDFARPSDALMAA